MCIFAWAHGPPRLIMSAIGLVAGPFGAQVEETARALQCQLAGSGKNKFLFVYTVSTYKYIYTCII